MNLELFYLVRKQPIQETDEINESKEKLIYISGPYANYQKALEARDAHVNRQLIFFDFDIVRQIVKVELV